MRTICAIGPGSSSFGRRECRADRDRPRQRIGERAAERERCRVHERAVLGAAAVGVRLREGEADRAGEDKVDDDRADHRAGGGVAEQGDEKRYAHEAGVREGGDERAERGVAQVDAASSRPLERHRDRQRDDRDRGGEVHRELHRIGEARERQARAEAKEHARQREEEHVGVEPRDRARRQPVPARRDPAEQDEAEERDRHRQDRLHGRAVLQDRRRGHARRLTAVFALSRKLHISLPLVPPMSASSPGPTRRFFRGVWRVVDVSRRVVLNLLFLLILAIVLVALIKTGPAPIAEKTALVLRIDGTIGEQKTGTLRSTALDQVRGEALQKVQLRDVLAVLEAAADDSRITSLVIVLDELRPTGFSTLREIAAAIDRFKASGKKVVAWGSGYDQRQYYVAAHADEVYLHPLGMVYIAGFGSLRNYYKDALDKLGVTVNVVRVGTFKSAVEPFIANEPSRPRSRPTSCSTAALADVRRRRREGAQARAGAIARSIDEAPQRLAAAGGDAAKFALAEKLVDALKTRDELRALMIERGAKDDDENTFRQVAFDDYLGHVSPRSRRCDRRRRRRGRDRRRPGAGGNDRRPLDRPT
jgi:ClpP class serine protease